MRTICGHKQTLFPSPLGKSRKVRGITTFPQLRLLLSTGSQRESNVYPGSKSVKYVPGLNCQLCPRSHTVHKSYIQQARAKSGRAVHRRIIRQLLITSYWPSIALMSAMLRLASAAMGPLG